jgi:hypothetical protein
MEWRNLKFMEFGILLFTLRMKMVDLNMFRELKLNRLLFMLHQKVGNFTSQIMKMQQQNGNFLLLLTFRMCGSPRQMSVLSMLKTLLLQILLQTRFLIRIRNMMALEY